MRAAVLRRLPHSTHRRRCRSVSRHVVRRLAHLDRSHRARRARRRHCCTHGAAPRRVRRLLGAAPPVTAMHAAGPWAPSRASGEGRRRRRRPAGSRRRATRTTGHGRPLATVTTHGVRPAAGDRRRGATCGSCSTCVRDGVECRPAASGVPDRCRRVRATWSRPQPGHAADVARCWTDQRAEPPRRARATATSSATTRDGRQHGRRDRRRDRRGACSATRCEPSEDRRSDGVLGARERPSGPARRPRRSAARRPRARARQHLGAEHRDVAGAQGQHEVAGRPCRPAPATADQDGSNAHPARRGSGTASATRARTRRAPGPRGPRRRP